MAIRRIINPALEKVIPGCFCFLKQWIQERLYLIRTSFSEVNHRENEDGLDMCTTVVGLCCSFLKWWNEGMSEYFTYSREKPATFVGCETIHHAQNVDASEHNVEKRQLDSPSPVMTAILHLLIQTNIGHLQPFSFLLFYPFLTM